MAEALSRRAILGKLVTRSQTNGSPARGNEVLIDEEIAAFHELLSADLSADLRHHLFEKRTSS